MGNQASGQFSGRPRTSIQAASAGLGSGYYRGGPPQLGGTGSMAGPQGAGTRAPASTQWHPTIVYLLALIAVELIAYSGLRYFTRNGHGG